MKFFRSALYRVFTSKQYWIQLGMAVLLSFFGIFLIKEMQDKMWILPREVLEVFRMGGNYNIGIVALPDLNVLSEPYCDAVIGGVFSGSVAQLLVVFAVVTFLCSELQNGYMHIAVMKGQARYLICLQYMGIAFIMVLSFMLCYMAGALAALLCNQMLVLKDPMTLCVILFTQMIMMGGIGICAAALTVMIGSRDVKIIVMSLMLALPLAPNYLYILTQGKIQIEKWFLVSQLISLNNENGSGISWNLLLTLLTTGVFLVGELCVFQTKKID